LDLNYVRENLTSVIKALEDRNVPIDFLTEFTNWDGQRRRAIAESDRLNAERNAVSVRIGALMKEGKGDEALRLRSEVSELKKLTERADQIRIDAERRIREVLSILPNIPHASVPVGKDETANTEIRRWGAKPEFDFEPQDHVDLGTALGILDLERATKIAGARFAILNGAGARLERALIDFMLDLHTREHGYRETLPPFIVNREALFGTGQLPKFEENLFRLEDERGLYLVPTAEVPVTNYYREEILDASQLPMKWAAYTPCFRSEAGSYGKDTRGVIRQHQFEKVELVKYSLPENSYDELESLTRDAETVLQRLGIHYRVVALSTGDLGFGSAKTYDIEVWLPSQNTFREISSCSNCEAFQARRANIRFRRAGGAKPEFVHTLNGSGLAIGRTWIAILENYQQADGSIVIPEALRPYMRGIERIR
ncbi:MAG TPA: serine--tRNA ligase, partial [Pyrinomonadaceae bacterium]|nr:serine--tRNA ligase [Pyrinomonadaceae bacterium]